MNFNIKIDPEALQDIQDIQEGIDWYNKKQPGYGQKFYIEVKNSFNDLKKHPFFQIRYDNVRCLPLDNYPYMIHYTVDEKRKLITIRAVLNTSQDVL